mmetsp:Transcript_19005/g.54306  ORF Transcript_19005/g.54306 Transcript_19005/m.54306 type:complete len:201 (-) Transcript_19005:688-1290(-)
MFLSDISNDSPSTYANDKLTLPAWRCVAWPFNTTSGTCSLIPAMSLSDNRSTWAMSFGSSFKATSAAAPRPTHKAVGNVPDLNPRSWPPPDRTGSNRTRGLRRTYNAPIPFGPYNLCPEIDTRSHPISFTSKGNFPTICAASVWKKALASFAIWPISFKGCSVPISLLTAITLTRHVSSLRTALLNSSRFTMPVARSTGK